MDFMKSLKEELDNRTQLTENGAVGYVTTGKALLDLNFSVSSLRNKSEKEIINKFIDAYYEDPLMAIKWLFYLRDREALGERRSFRVILKYLAREENKPELVKELLPLISEYGRWDDVFVLVGTVLQDDVISLIKKQLKEDVKNMKAEKPVSLLAKWMPSMTAYSVKTKHLALTIREALGMTPKEYRNTLTSLRKYLDVIERKMSAGEWDKINYSTVPSRANLLYSKAFLKHDEERRRKFLNALERGDRDAKINASVLFPHDIVHRYVEIRCGSWSTITKSVDTTLEELWKALPDFVEGNSNTICVADGSGSMTAMISGTSVRALSVANALAIYFSERCSGQFKNKYITFSYRPQFVDFSNVNTLREKIEIALRHDEVANTNIEAVFDLILNTAINNNMAQEDIPQNILILSDMEFDYATSERMNKTLFEEIELKYLCHGYKLPRLVFWNILSRTGTIPVKQNELGVVLVSGFSPTIVKMVLSNSTDPYKCLLEQLNDERYKPVEEVVKRYL